MEKQKIIYIYFSILLLTLFFTISYQVVNAEEKKTEVSLPVYQEFKVYGNTTQEINTKVKYMLKREKEEFPLPNASSKNDYEISIDGKNAKGDINLTFNKEGVYKYEISVLNKDEGNYRYDKSIYKVEIYVDKEDDSKLSKQIIVRSASGEKKGEIKFNHVYKRQLKVIDNIFSKTPQTGDINNIYLWISTAAISLLVCSLLVKRNKKSD
ncbi:Spy0128 family protein [Peptostreptococcus russellii]|uniref:Spy0128 family protein n=1 Tax=Peptostreptococcus russellii TaxID=215200 RepID=UPI0026EADF87|nr:FctA domain-containing protein [Peptostreptococcus russellii]